MTEPVGFIATKEYRRFEEFCEACRRERYIGLCYGPPGVGKTVSARRYARWDLFEGRDPFDRTAAVSDDVAQARAVMITPGVTNTPRSVRMDVDAGRMLLRGLARPPSWGSGVDQVVCATMGVRISICDYRRLVEG